VGALRQLSIVSHSFGQFKRLPNYTPSVNCKAFRIPACPSKVVWTCKGLSYASGPEATHAPGIAEEILFARHEQKDWNVEPGPSASRKEKAEGGAQKIIGKNSIDKKLVICRQKAVELSVLQHLAFKILRIFDLNVFQLPVLGDRYKLRLDKSCIRRDLQLLIPFKHFAM
jgi:hypothetical protein